MGTGVKTSLLLVSESVWSQLEDEFDADQKHADFVMAVVDSEERTQALEEQISVLSNERNKIQENVVQMLGPDLESAKNFFSQF